MNFDPNVLYYKMAEEVSKKRPDQKLIIGNEGGSRSSKTWDEIHLIAAICDANRNKKLQIYFFRDTLSDCKEYLLKDFKECLSVMGIWDDANHKDNQGKPIYNLFGQLINFRGVNETKEATGSDIIFFNEILSGMEKEKVMNWIMRCRLLVLADWNPRYSDHWFFSFQLRNDTVFFHSTYKNNRHLGQSVIAEIQGYQTVRQSSIAIKLGSQNNDEAKSYDAEIKANAYNTEANPDEYSADEIAELVRCKYNEDTKTADAYKWAVYGLGERRSPEGLIFPNVTWVKRFPENCEKIYWGLDFGYTESPSVLVKVGVIGMDMYSEIKFYQPTPSSNILIPLLRQHITDQDTVWADPSGDSGGRGMITACRRDGLRVFGANTFPGSIKFGISILKKYNLHLIDCPEWRDEQSGYVKAKAKVNGSLVTLDDPIDAKNHAWDAKRITALSNRL